MGTYKNWIAYQKGFDLALKIHSVTKTFPAQEQFSLIDQIRRSSRSVCTNLAEAYYKSNYKKHFTSKLLDASSENGETQVWLEFSLSLEYLDEKTFQNLIDSNNEIGKLLWYMIHYPNKFQQPLL